MGEGISLTAPMNQQTQQDPTAAAIVATYLAATAALRSRLLGIVAAAYASETNNYGDIAAAAFVTQVVPAVQAAQQTMAALTSAYLSHLISSAAGGTTAPVGVPLEMLSAVRGVDQTEVYRRPYVQVWTDLSRGKDLQEAVAAGGRRAQSLAATDIQLAKTHASREVLRHDDRVTGYRRVLVGAHSCALCVLASTRWYSRGDLLPIHPGCDCQIQPLFRGERPSEVPAERIHDAIARDLGEKYVSASGKKGAAQYRDIVVTHDHGEIGPVLAVRGQAFKGPGELNNG